MKKKILKVLKVLALVVAYLAYAGVIIIGARQGLNYFYNRYVLSHYEDGDYSINENLLLTFNIIEPYVVHYNNGNIYYKNSLFDEAIEEFKTASEYDNLPEDKECQIQINWALSVVAKLPEDYDTKENRESSIELLQEAMDVLTDKGCADEDGNGHSDDAQKLYDEIAAEKERLEQEMEEEQQQASQQPEEEEEEQQDGDDGGSQQNQSNTVNPQNQNGNGDENQDDNGNDDQDGAGNMDDKPQKPENPNGDDEEEEEEPMSFEDYEAMMQQQLQQLSEQAYEERVHDLQEYQEADWNWWDWSNNYEGIW